MRWLGMAVLIVGVAIVGGCSLCIPEESNREKGNVITQDGEGRICSASPGGTICGRRCMPVEETE